ncbi:PTS galactosamine/N-acetylgalactosamine transporter subunit IIA [Yersinia similis]|uniref:PTS mannose transporter subunit IIA n=1 Tax=Yersinia similis TaxID=367190 RepID=A0A0T9PNC6_9GAMM|nr:PTS galactosamine/N-acetylgalactosamine transporter subunit IIA [Yersinia similis]AHK18256.1 PTS mannose transporter subunit IIA [Yersinia similis]CFQ56687.1 PTS system N-acetylgalactosamine-specific transporter subunit IIA component [Yersinia similis]CNB48766.1 PTS system N-acetylgalactosamine-specific transporter subunit IIA component [Yersinia similis]CNF68902.1 PTS system N-acetylgalactosamine-specific transporter subunit IIA component [Yersinia similis]CNH74173.1 PTS system N-acetylgal
MIGIVVSGHINFASGMASAVRAITGEQSQMLFIDFVESMSTDMLESELRHAAHEVDSGEGVLFLTDIPGGSPCNRALNILMSGSNVELLAGVNLPMIANAAFEREGASLSELVEILMDIGASSVQNLRAELDTALVTDDCENEDGL